MSQERDDRVQILDVLNRYCIGADRSALDGVVSLFAPEAVFEFGDRRYDGHDAIREMFAESGRRVVAAGAAGGLQHLPASSVTDLDGDSAAAASYVQVFGQVADGVGRGAQMTTESGPLVGVRVIGGRSPGAAGTPGRAGLFGA